MEKYILEQTLLDFLDAKQKIVEFMLSADEKEIKLQKKALNENSIVADELMKLQEFNIAAVGNAISETFKWLIARLVDFKNIMIKYMSVASKVIKINVAKLKIYTLNTEVEWYVNDREFSAVYSMLNRYVDNYKIIRSIRNASDINSFKAQVANDIKFLIGNRDISMIGTLFRAMANKSMLKTTKIAKEIDVLSSLENIKNENNTMMVQYATIVENCDKMIKELTEISPILTDQSRVDLHNSFMDKYLMEHSQNTILALNIMKIMILDYTKTFNNAINKLNVSSDMLKEQNLVLDGIDESLIHELEEYENKMILENYDIFSKTEFMLEHNII